jgi:hypothetical protein
MDPWHERLLFTHPCRDKKHPTTCKLKSTSVFRKGLRNDNHMVEMGNRTTCHACRTIMYVDMEDLNTKKCMVKKRTIGNRKERV